VIQASGDAEGARLLLRSLISEENTRLTLPLSEICRRTKRSREAIAGLMQLLVQGRIVREIQEREPWRYELIHEYLIDKINQVTGQVLDATQKANRHFRQYLVNYSLDQRTRIPLTRWWSINRYSDLPRGLPERELMRKSLRWGLTKLTGATLLLAAITITAAAFLSVNETWEGKRLSDGHTAAARRVLFTPDGKRVVSCGEDGKIIVWDVATRQRIATLSDHQGWVNWIDLSADGKWLASGGEDHQVIIWDASTFEKVRVLNEHRTGVTAVAFSPNSKRLLTASTPGDYRTVIWEVDGWHKLAECSEGMTWGQFLFLDNDRAMFAGGYVYDVKTGKHIDQLPPGGNYGQLYAKGTRLISIDGVGLVQFRDTANRSVIGSVRAHQFHGRAAIVSPDERLAATGAEDIVLWDVATQTKLLRLSYTAEVWGLAFSPDGRWLVSSHNDGAILLWDMKERELTANFNEHSGSVRAVAFSGNGALLASVSEDRSVIVWDTRLGRKQLTLNGHNTRVTSVAFGPGGSNWLVSGDQDGETIQWDLTQGMKRWRSKIPSRSTPDYCLTVSPDGRHIAHTNGIQDSADGRMMVDFYELAIAEKIGGQFYGLSFSNDGQRLLGVTSAGDLVIFETGSWQIIKRTRLPDASLICVSFAPDDRSFITGEDGGEVRLWETSTLRQIAIVGKHAARIKSIEFSPDGREVVSAGDDQTISLWNVARRRLIANLGSHTAPVLGVDFAPDGKRIASAGQDKSVHVYTRRRMLWGYNLD
jgi:WD40 repeat protein